MPERNGTPERSDPSGDEVRCPDCDGPSAWVSKRTGWAKCSGCELAWPALPSRFRGPPPTGAVVTLPDGWRVRRPRRADGYRSDPRSGELHVEVEPPVPTSAFVLLCVAGVSALGALLALGHLDVRLVVELGLVASICAGAALAVFRRRLRRGPDVTFAAGAARLRRDGGTSVACGQVERLEARGASGGDARLEMTTAGAGRVVLADGGGTPAQVESLLREIGRHLAMTFARENGELIARRRTEPQPVRVAGEAADDSPDGHDDAEGEIGRSNALEAKGAPNRRGRE